MHKLIKKRSKFALMIIWSLCLTGLVGCTASRYSSGLSSLQKKDYNEAIRLFQEAEKEKPADARIKRELGITYFKARRFDEALLKLQEAKGLNPRDSKTIFYLGLTYESKDMLKEAIDEYKNYRDLSRSGGFRNEISRRIKQLSSEQIAREISAAISQEQNLNVEAIPENTIAVLYFRNISQASELDPLQKGLAQILITDLSKVRQLKVVERLKLQTLLEELELGSTGLVDNRTAPRVGKLIGARKLVSGGITQLSDENIRIDAALAETATSQLSPVEEVSGKLPTLFRMQKKLAFSIISDLGIVLSKTEREAIEKISTENLLAFLAYSRGLDFEDRGMFDRAKQEYEKALSLDPNFELAKQSVEDLEISEQAASEPKIATAALENDFDSTFEDFGGLRKVSRLFNTSHAAQTGQTPQGDNDTREPVQEATGTDSAIPTTATVPIIIPLPPASNK
ncbi:MAG: CsgG/HfaB family protein [bacterium]